MSLPKSLSNAKKKKNKTNIIWSLEQLYVTKKTPKEIYSDQGIHLTGNELQGWANKMTFTGIFNCPTTPLLLG